MSRRPPGYPKLAEKIVMDALDERGIEYVFEGCHKGVEAHKQQAGLDFWLPTLGLHIEVKDFHSPRIAGQMARVENIIAIQGRKAAQVFADLIRSQRGAGGAG